MTTVHKLNIYNYSVSYTIETQYRFRINESKAYKLLSKISNLELCLRVDHIKDEIDITDVTTSIYKTISEIPFKNIRFNMFTYDICSLILKNLNLTNLTSCFIRITSKPEIELVNEILNFCPYLGDLTLRGFRHNSREKITYEKELSEMFDNILEKSHLWNFNFDVNIISNLYLKYIYLERFFLEIDVIPNFYEERIYHFGGNIDFIVRTLMMISKDFSKYISKRWVIPVAFIRSCETFYESDIEFTFFGREMNYGSLDEYSFDINDMDKEYCLPFRMVDHCVSVGFIKIVVLFI
jgi:hypothetical protein